MYMLCMLCMCVAMPPVTRVRPSLRPRYVLCPFIDMMNHASSRAATDVAYEYFTDNFAVVLDGQSVRSGTEAHICYGPQTNDALLQYYGFVEANNPHDTFQIEKEVRSTP